MKDHLCLLFLIWFLLVSLPPSRAADNPAIVSPARITSLKWIRQGAMMAQTNHTRHRMHGATKPHNAPMSDMKTMGQEEHKPHDHYKHHKQLNVSEKMQPRSALKPAEGAKVKILSPKVGEEVKGEEIDLHFELVKGKRGHHIHAYVDETLMGMFTTDDGGRAGAGALTGISPGRHTLEIRAVTEDHNVELDATDTIHFIVK